MVGLASVALFACSVAVSAQTPPAPCSTPEHHQFDFWIGDWRVEDSAGNLAGTNDVKSVLKGCVLQENWVGTAGMSGSSYNIYDSGNKLWRQSWVDDRGGTLQLEGHFADGKMVLVGSRPHPRKPGVTQTNRITWSKLDGGRVRQFWESSEDGGKTWTPAFEGIYVRKP
jgi:hypothetical protein